MCHLPKGGHFGVAVVSLTSHLGQTWLDDDLVATGVHTPVKQTTSWRNNNSNNSFIGLKMENKKQQQKLTNEPSNQKQKIWFDLQKNEATKN